MLVHRSQMYATGLARHPPVAHDTLHIDRADLMRLPWGSARCSSDDGYQGPAPAWTRGRILPEPMVRPRYRTYSFKV